MDYTIEELRNQYFENKNIIKDYKVTDKNVTLSLDGTILKNAKYDLNELNAKIKSVDTAIQRIRKKATKIKNW